MAKVEYRFVNEGKVVFKKFARGLAVTFVILRFGSHAVPEIQW